MANEIVNNIQACMNILLFGGTTEPQLGNGQGFSAVSRNGVGSYQAILDLPLKPYTAPAQSPNCAIFITCSGFPKLSTILHPDGTKVLFFTFNNEDEPEDFQVMIDLMVVKFPQIE